MKIFVVPSWYPDSENAIRGIFFKEQVHALKKEGIDIVVLYPEIWSIKNFIKKKPGLSCEVEDGIKTYRLKGYNFIPRAPRIAYYIYRARLKRLFSLALQEEGVPDLIHAHSLIWGGLAVEELAAKLHVPLVVTEHSSAFGRGLLKPFHENLIKMKVNNIQHFIAVSGSLKNDISAYIPHKEIEVIPNIVDTNFFTISKKKRNKFTFFSLAMLNKNKGIDLLIKAFARRFKGSNAELVIGGDGIEKKQLEQLAEDLQVKQQVTFLGRLGREEAAVFMKECHVFVLPSRYETFGVVYIEALSCGKPVIATKCGGPEIMINDRNGLLVELDNVEELGNAMSYLHENYGQYDPEKIRQDCIDNFSEHAIAVRLKKYYKDVLRG